MQKAMTMYKTVIQGVENFHYFDSSCPTEIAKLSLIECLKWIGQIEDSHKAAAEAAKAAQEAQGEPDSIEDKQEEVYA